ncbi:MAG: hypothetical protein A3C70_00210 [Candidatus Zambryskibacteria bacterium RIFCSPHIGHO2_02_FULL_43_14]|uniref:Uncharacterized protein n=1 Tax=Candidatus Zambryskibacteria bacterium RIFCSPHIGHO2_02_FULL_43_14 TaxID=1802748 RepID=A0A1G2TGX3_9BACT|nr:MAG: hypothetical protein A2829_03260 [Candidatus Zambryskibacteria bacterium RIFCSPHIGHO2_01_FULL_43_60]OHA95871.1 MAG: hypothetical protein A3C70_00210 [Candidatus Zambryskibacteria bacterium RIFCSPHIGHO2_02_FULL_43_14]OHB03408.1 MAG: hypothetical protein A3B03_02395 [Candidatus Zambryskibacteria bacterium RIFCSPLOWO2_01_FULL_42_41]
MKTLAKNKGILATVAIFILVIFLYNLFFKSETDPVPSELSASNIGDNLVKTQKELQAVTLDKTLFSSPGYLLLTDFSISVPSQPTGRSNPFDIIGRN